MPRKNRRAQGCRLPAIPLGFFDDIPGLYEVTVSNNSGVRKVEIDGTQASAWAWAAQAGRQGAFGPGRWEPQSIRLVAPSSSELFATV